MDCSFKIEVPETTVFFLHSLNRIEEKIGKNTLYTLNKKSLNGRGKSMVTVLRRKFLVQWGNLHDFTGWIKRYVSVHFSKQTTVESSLEGNSLVKSTRYLIVLFFRGGIFRPNRPVFNWTILYRLDTLQLTREEEKSSVAQCSTGWFKKNFLECSCIGSIFTSSKTVVQLWHLSIFGQVTTIEIMKRYFLFLVTWPNIKMCSSSSLSVNNIF